MEPTKKHAMDPKELSRLYAGGAQQYFSAAKELCSTHISERTIKLPRLFMLTQGMELLFKATLLGKGVSESRLKNPDISHRLLALWEHPKNNHLRQPAEQHAISAWAKASSDPRWQGLGEFSASPIQILYENIGDLSRLHGKSTDYILRYPSKQQILGRRPHFLVDTFLSTAQWYLDMPDRLYDTAID